MCPHARWIARSDAWSGGACPSVKGARGKWLGSPLFATAELGGHVPAHDGSAPTRLATYCAFTWFGDGPEEPGAIPWSPSPFASQSDIPAPDCTIAAPTDSASDDPDNAIAIEPKYTASLAHTAQMQWAVSSSLHEHVDGARTVPPPRIALIDTGVFGKQPHGQNPHGELMARAAAAIAPCSSGPCLAEVQSHLAFPHVTADTTDYERGGHFGTLGQTAVAIWDAVAAWRAEGAGGPQGQSLIVNLSLGWKRRFARDTAADLAVRDAIAYARCAGALPIAAAGNRESLTDRDVGALLPAAWEHLALPDAATCGAYFGVAAPRRSKYEPLLYSAHAVDGRDQPIAATRVRGRSGLAVYGAMVALPSEEGLAPPTMTGSSVAAAALSGMAALVWSVRPEWTAGEVMTTLHDHGVDLGLEADYGLAVPGLGSRRIRRASACSAVAFALGTAPERLGCSTVPAYRGRNARTKLVWRDIEPALAQTLVGAVRTSADALRGDERVDRVRNPWSGPQPTSPICPACRVTPDALGMASQLVLEATLARDALINPPDALLLTLHGAAGDMTYSIVPPLHTRAFTVPLDGAPLGGIDYVSLSVLRAPDAEGARTTTLEQLLFE
jgi:hypothetical protein